MKLKIKFAKTSLPKLLFGLLETSFNSFGNDIAITMDVNNWGTLGIKNKSNNPISITLIPRS
ncbi:hypothetical protein [Spiroplasma sp. Moj]|uniref:hypothetical protein n=1 Tax=Spiroplasma sp. Moj TaxID=1922342 RepID=UPI0039F095E6|nr:hypothetical protein [Spiroplasma sp. Moj]